MTVQAPPEPWRAPAPPSPGMALLQGEGPDYSISAESPAQVVPCWIRHLHGNPRLGRCGLGRCHLHGNRCGARMRPGCAGHRVPRREERGVSAPRCRATEAERLEEQGPPLFPARDGLGRAFLSLTFQPQTCLPCPVSPALCQAEPLASVRSRVGAQPLSYPGNGAQAHLGEDCFQPMGTGGVQGHGNSPIPISKGAGLQRPSPGIQGCSMTAPVLALTS